MHDAGPSLPDGDGVAPDAGATDSANGPSCAPRALGDLAALAAAKGDPCSAWTNRIRGRVGRGSVGSFAVWTKNTSSSLALIVGALHTVGLAAENVSVPAFVSAPDPEGGILRLYIPPADGSFGALLRAPAFAVFRPAVPAAQNTKTWTYLQPRNDFYVDVMDGQRLEDDGLAEPLPDTLQAGPVPVFDPDGLLTTSPSFGAPAPGDVVAYAGHPRTGPLAGKAAIGFGRVLSHAEATSAIAALSASNDGEGLIAYDQDAEMLISGEAFVGMSGGGAFDASGRLVGTIVRASTVAVNGTKYVRAVRTSFIASELATASKGKAALAPYLPKP